MHTGTTSTITFKPAPENYGIKFIRTDLGGQPEIPAIADYVVDISRGTTIGLGDAKVHTVEHVLAVVVGLQIDNIKIEIDGIEPPLVTAVQCHSLRNYCKPDLLLKMNLKIT